MTRGALLRPRGHSIGMPPARDHVAVLLYAIEQGYDPVPEHVVRLALSDIAAAGFDPSARVLLPPSLAGYEWRGRVLQRGEEMPVGEASYLEHAFDGDQWPDDLTLAAYLRSIRDVVLDSTNGVCIAREHDADRIVVCRRSNELRGERGNDYVLVVFDPGIRHWTAAWQPPEGLALLANHPWSAVSWLRVPE